MSSLPGHARITRKAVELLEAENRGDPVYLALGFAGVPASVVARDILDVVLLGHWADFGQCHHFMRRFDGQSEREAHAEAVHWIWKNAVTAARILSRQISATLAPGGARTTAAVSGSLAGGDSGITSSQALGNALHAVQDSFAWGHVERDEPRGSRPGDIRRVKRYAGAEKDGHAEADELWKGHYRQGFSETGWFAVCATRDLLRIVVDSANAARGGRAVSLLRFEAYRDQWLRASEALSNQRDRAFDLIDRHYTGVRLGASNLKTINFDEEGLARALVEEAGADTRLVLEVFERLRDHYSSDSDDVAELYVNLVRKHKGPLEAALRSNPALIGVLVQVMDEGWTSGGESECIEYLKGLR
jgi:hypothetical protein